MKWLAMILAAALGAALVVLGCADDSPGLQGIGTVILTAALILGLRAARCLGHD